MTTPAHTALIAIEYARREHVSQSIAGACWAVTDGVWWGGREGGSIQVIALIAVLVLSEL